MLKQRVITALWLIPVALLGFFLLDGISFAVFVGIVIVLGAWEWAALAGLTQQLQRCSYAAVTAVGLLALFYLPNIKAFLMWLAVLWWIVASIMVLTYPHCVQWWGGLLGKLAMGWLILLPAWQGLVILKSWPHSNFLILSVMLMIWAADIGAYFFGKKLGCNKLAPKVSPGKSWEGAIGGLLCSLLMAAILWTQIQHESVHLTFGVAMLGALPVIILSIIGDLTESMFKRQSGIKDSSQLLPGHGGILDRVDSLTAAVPVFVVLLSLSGWGAM